MTTAVTIKSETALITITPEDVKSLICPKATDVEIALFLRVCQAEQLNPFTKEIYLIKYSDNQPAAIVTSIQAWQKAAEDSPEYDGHENGLLVFKDGKVEERPGAFTLPGETFGKDIIGGYARVYRKDRSHPFYYAVSYREAVQTKADGTPNRFWSTQPGTQMVTTPLRRALKQAMPHRYQNLDERDVADVEAEMADHTIPVAFRLPGGKLNWDAFYAKIKELGVDHAGAQEILGCASIKVWSNTHSLEEAYETIRKYIADRANTKNKADLFEAPQPADKPQGVASGTAAPEVVATATTEIKEPPAKADSFDRQAAWITTCEKVKALKIEDKLLLDWWERHDVEVSPGTFKEPMPPERITDNHLKTFLAAMAKKEAAK